MKAKSEKAKNEKTDYGLVANGSTQKWDIALDETLSGPQRWFAQFDGPVGYLCFQVRSPKIIDELLSFVTYHLGGDGRVFSTHESTELEVSRFGGNTVTFLWDDETNDQCFVLVSGKAELRMRLCVSRSQLADMSKALQQVKDDLCEEGLLCETG